MISLPFEHLKRHALWLLLAFFVALGYFAGRNLAEKHAERDNARLIHAWTRTSLAINALVHELQKERGLSSGWLSSQGRYFDVALQRQRDKTDAALLALQADLAAAAAGRRNGAGSLAAQLSPLLPEFAQLGEWREQIMALKVSRDAAVDRYSLLVEALFEPQLATMSIGRVGWIYRQQMAFIFFLQAKEMAGQERALLTAMLSAADYSPMRIAAYYRISAVEQARLEKFLQLADEEALAGYRRLASADFSPHIDKIRRHVAAVAASGRPPDGHMPSAGSWFDVATRRIDAMSAFEDVLSDRLLASAARLEREASHALWINAGVVAVSLLLAAVLLRYLWRGAQYVEAAEVEIEQLRSFDPLTGLPNRAAWHATLDQAVTNARRSSGHFALLDIDIDRLKRINESLGHAVGDQVLIQVGEQLKRLLGRHDSIARPGGDRFALLLPDLADAQATGLFCERILAAFGSPMHVKSHTLSLSVSIGIALYPNDGEDPRTLLQNAESALNRAKETGRGSYMFYAPAMNAAGAHLLALERLLREALVHDEFQVVFQPQIAAGSRRLVGVEALLRWHNPQLGNVSPVQFIPIAEATGQIVPIGEWVLRESCRQARAWRDRFGAEIPVAVNLSARQFAREDLMVNVKLALETHGLAGDQIELEITEGLLMADPAGSAVIMSGLRLAGLKIALDDFGTGYSSLAYLKNFPLDRLKLDRAFVKDLPDNESDKAIAHAVIALGRNLGLQTLAEGVETEAQAAFLAAAGCDVFQGYLYGKPMAAAELEARITAGDYELAPRPAICPPP